MTFGEKCILLAEEGQSGSVITEGVVVETNGISDVLSFLLFVVDVL